ncbi:hypothetical protein [Candidatus Bandiella euplotis]|nr:hypothetical protein [Candidatus Bandiella woodruffii]
MLKSISNLYLGAEKAISKTSNVVSEQLSGTYDSIMSNQNNGLNVVDINDEVKKGNLYWDTFKDKTKKNAYYMVLSHL